MEPLVFEVFHQTVIDSEKEKHSTKLTTTSKTDNQKQYRKSTRGFIDRRRLFKYYNKNENKEKETTSHQCKLILDATVV
ncbi:MAG: hypothetical protein L3J59_03510 [Methylococcaceae bacterium]|nr:hypothetical protein [Methylococcaceae bacterium]